MVASLCVEAVACEQAVGAKLVESVGTCVIYWSQACVWKLSLVSKRWVQNLSNLLGRVSFIGRELVCGSGRLRASGGCTTGRICWDVCIFLVASLCVEAVACEQAVGAKLVGSVGTYAISWSRACVWKRSRVSKRWVQNWSDILGHVSCLGRKLVFGSGRL